MAKFDPKKLIKLIENLVDKKMEATIDERVEKKVQKLMPMLVEHEVNRILREETAKFEQPVHSSKQPELQTESTGNKIVDEVIDETEADDQRKQLRERFSALIGEKPRMDSDGNRTISMNSSNVNKGHNSNGVHVPDKGPDGQPIDVSNPNVQKVAKIMNQDFSKTLDNIRKKSKARGGQIPQGGRPAGG